MPHLVAALDGSAYTDSVCDYAAWFAGRLDLDIRLLAVSEAGAKRGGRAQAALHAGVARLAEQGAEASEAQSAHGAFVPTCAQQAASPGSELVVLGKRGTGSAADDRRLGSQITPLLRATDIPICLASRTFLPIGRAVALLDAALEHRRTVDYLRNHPALAALDLDVVVGGADDTETAAKVNWARRELPGPRTDVFAIQAEGLNPSAAQVLSARGADLVIVSRAVLAAEPQRALEVFESHGLWAWRTPVLIC